MNVSTYVTLRFASDVSAEAVADRLTDYRFLAHAGGWPFELYAVTTVPKGRRLVISTRQLGFRAHDPDKPLLPWCSPPEYGSEHDRDDEALGAGGDLRGRRPAQRGRAKVDQHEPDPAHHGYEVRHQAPPLPRQQTRTVEVTPR